MIVVINGRVIESSEDLAQQPTAKEALPLLWALSDDKGRQELDALVAEVARGVS